MANKISVYIDSEYRCHAESADGLREMLTDAFIGREDQISNFRLVPQGESWTRSDGVVFYGEMFAPVAVEIQADIESQIAELEALLAALKAKL